MITQSKKEQIKINLEELDLDLIQKTMSNFGWTWKFSKTGERRVPNVNDIYNVAKACMERACESENQMATDGGFEATVENGAIEIRYILTQANLLYNSLG